MKSKCKVIIVGVGNSGTKLLGDILNEQLTRIGYPAYHYEPLYWSGTQGERGIVHNPEGIKEHQRFPLKPDDKIQTWPWLERFVDNLEGLAKFIRLGSRIRFVLKHDVKVIWITRELYSYLASMQKNFPRCLPDAGWHHRPGKYDDYSRLKEIYSDFNLRPEEPYRVEVEAAWWHLHNENVRACLATSSKICHIRYEDLCAYPGDVVDKVMRFLELPMGKIRMLSEIRSVPERDVTLSPRNIRVIEDLAGAVNRLLYPKIC